MIAVLLAVIAAFMFTAARAENYYEYRIHAQYIAPFSPELFGDNNVLYSRIIIDPTAPWKEA